MVSPQNCLKFYALPAWECWKYTVIGYHFILVVYCLIIYCLSTLLLIHTSEHSIQPYE